MKKISRRDFLKAVPALAAGTYAALGRRGALQTQRPNIIVIVLDAMSASNLSLYGYPRETTPSLNRFAERCHVYHAHCAAGNFTTAGTASMLTGLYPWTHRAFHYGGMITRALAGNTFFALADAGYSTTAFCQNPWADRLVAQVPGGVDRFLPLTSFSLRGDSLLMQRLAGDRALSSIASDEFLFDLSGGDTMASPLLGYLYQTTHQNIEAARDHDQRYPRGLPEIDGYALYANQEVYRGVLAQLLELNELPGPHLSYFHLYSPHQPYKPDRRHLQLFADGLTFAAKPTHPFNTDRGYNEKDLAERRLRYDQQVAHVDTEFGNLIAGLEAAGVLENSHVIVTADHGEMFERGFFGHGERMMYEPVVHIPLLVHTPGQTERRDVHSPTSNVDLAPTLFTLSGVTPSIKFDGELLPGLGGVQNHDRALFSMEASQNPSFAPVTKAVISMRRGDHKIIAYPGYEDVDGRFELYHLAEDPQELRDLSADDSALLKTMREELLDNLAQANAVFQR